MTLIQVHYSSVILRTTCTCVRLSRHHQSNICVIVISISDFLPKSPVPVLLHLLALQLKPSLLVRFVSAGASALHIHTLPFGFDPGGARDRSWIGRGVLTTPPFVGPFCRPVGDQSTAQSTLAHRPFDTQLVLKFDWSANPISFNVPLLRTNQIAPRYLPRLECITKTPAI